MRWSRAKLRMVNKLQAIERAHKTAAEARLGSARRAADEAEASSRKAKTELHAAEQSWVDRLSAGQVDMHLQRMFGDELLRRERELQASEQEQEDADVRLEHARKGWQQLEAGVRAGDRILKKGRNFLSRQGEELRAGALSDLTTWEWFKR